MKLRFALLSEGSSERGLVPHIVDLCVRLGAQEVEGFAPDFGRLPNPPGRSITDKLAILYDVMGDLDFVCVHRDADNAGAATRRREISKAAQSVSIPAVPIIPITMLEAWLLLDEGVLCAAVGQPRASISLPKRRQIESIADPKAHLKQLLAKASGASGRRLKQVNRRFPQNRAYILERLDLDGPIKELSSWQALLEDLEATIKQLKRASR